MQLLKEQQQRVLVHLLRVRTNFCVTSKVSCWQAFLPAACMNVHVTRSCVEHNVLSCVEEVLRLLKVPCAACQTGNLCHFKVSEQASRAAARGPADRTVEGGVREPCFSITEVKVGVCALGHMFC